jgi:capsular polysaccharide biosynthesis protein
LVYSHPGSVLSPPYMADEQINALKYYFFNLNDKKSNEKIWLSRSKLLVGTIINESLIEKILTKIGYKIIHPEILSLQEQVRLISTSDIVAGFDGSQFYTVLFATEISGKFHIFNRRPKIPDAIPYVFQKRNIEFELHNFDVEYICGEGAWSYYNHSEPEKIIEVLQNL